MDIEQLVLTIGKVEGPLAIAFASILTLSHLRNSHLSERARDIIKFFFQHKDSNFPNDKKKQEFKENIKAQEKVFIQRYKETGQTSKWLLLAITSYISGKIIYTFGSSLEDSKTLFAVIFSIFIAVAIAYTAKAAIVIVKDMNNGHKTLEENGKLIETLDENTNKPKI